MGSKILTYTNRLVDPLNLPVEDICIEDIARSLSMQCRFGGHVKRHYSVAQHSFYLSHLVPKEDALWGLLHDATEAYMVDVPRPIKKSPDFLGYRIHEERLMRTICERFNLPKKQPPSVKIMDDRLLITEAQQVANPFPLWDKEGKELVSLENFVIETWQPKEAEEAFLFRFGELR